MIDDFTSEMEEAELSNSDYCEICIKETFKKNGVIHRDFDQPAIIYTDRDTGDTVQKEFYLNGKRHRISDNPAIIFAGFGYKIEQYFKNNKRHRDNGKPAYIDIDDDGFIMYERYYENDLAHRSYCLPADITRSPHPPFIVTTELYLEKGIITRRDGPAYIERSENTGIAMMNIYFRDGKYYSDGTMPAQINRDPDTGKITSKYSAEELNIREPLLQPA